MAASALTSLTALATLIPLTTLTAGCDQYARVGVVASDSSGSRDAGDPGPGRDGGGDGGLVDAGPDSLCRPPAVAVCNPVTNEGCSDALLMHCAVDLVARGTAGYCIFTGRIDGGTCLNTGVTESCPPKSACFEGECRRLCFCDSDCPVGCCTMPLTEFGFKVCGDCP